MATLQVTSPAPRSVWREVLAADPEALVSQTPEWIDAICAVGGYEDASCLYETEDGRRLILPTTIRRRWPAALASQASLPPGWGTGGLLAPGGVRVDEVTAVFRDLASRGARTLLRPNPLQAAMWGAAKPPGVITVPRLAHVLDLDGGFSYVWEKRFSSGARRAVRKAERSALTVECDTSGKLVPVFDALYRQSIDRWADQQHEPRPLARWRAQRRDPLRKFLGIASRVGDSCRWWVAWKDGRPAAAILVLQGINTSYTRGAMDKEIAGPTYANHLLHRLAIEDACRAGCRRYHMGESGASGGLARFKGSFGARPQEYAEYQLERLPITRTDTYLRRLVKRLIGFKDVAS